MTATAVTWTEEYLPVAGNSLHLLKGGSGAPVVLLPHEIGYPGPLPFHEELAQSFSVYVPSHPGFGKSERPQWMRSVRDLAVAQQWLITSLGLESVTLVGLGFGGWVAAEMATMAPRQFARLVLVGPMGIKPAQGEILDQALVSYIDYVKLGLHNQRIFEQVYGQEPSTEQLIAWDVNREMSFRVAWKPYMYSQTLPHLLGGVQAPSLIVWGDDDRIVPSECGEHFRKALPNARLEMITGCGHLVELEKPRELAALIADFAREGE